MTLTLNQNEPSINAKLTTGKVVNVITTILADPKEIQAKVQKILDDFCNGKLGDVNADGKINIQDVAEKIKNELGVNWTSLTFSFKEKETGNDVIFKFTNNFWLDFSTSATAVEQKSGNFFANSSKSNINPDGLVFSSSQQALDVEQKMNEAGDKGQRVLTSFRNGYLSAYGFTAVSKPQDFIKAVNGFREDLLACLKDLPKETKQQFLNNLISSFKAKSGLDITALTQALLTESNKSIVDIAGEMLKATAASGKKSITDWSGVSKFILSNLEHTIPKDFFATKYPQFSKEVIAKFFNTKSDGSFTLRIDTNYDNTLTALIQQGKLKLNDGLKLGVVINHFASQGIMTSAHQQLAAFDSLTVLDDKTSALVWSKLKTLATKGTEIKGIQHLENVKNLGIKMFSYMDNEGSMPQPYSLLGGWDSKANQFVFTDINTGDKFTGKTMEEVTQNFIGHNSIGGPGMLFYNDSKGVTQKAEVTYDLFEHAKDFGGSILGNAGIIVTIVGAALSETGAGVIVAGVGLGMMAGSSAIITLDTFVRLSKGQDISAKEWIGVIVQDAMIGGGLSKLIFSKLSQKAILAGTAVTTGTKMGLTISTVAEKTGSYGFYLLTAYDGAKALISKDPQLAFSVMYNLSVIGALKMVQQIYTKPGSVQQISKELEQNGAARNSSKETPEMHITRVRLTTEEELKLTQSELDADVQLAASKGVKIPRYEEIKDKKIKDTANLGKKNPFDPSANIAHEFAGMDTIKGLLQKFLTKSKTNLISYLSSEQNAPLVIKMLKEMAGTKTVSDVEMKTLVNNSRLLMTRLFSGCINKLNRLSEMKSILMKQNSDLFSVSDKPTPSQIIALSKYRIALNKGAIVLQAKLQSIITSSGYTEFSAVNVRTKDSAGILDKISRMRKGKAGEGVRPDYTLGDMPDALGGRITVESISDLPAIMKGLETTFGKDNIMEVENFYLSSTKSQKPYRVITYTVLVDNGNGVKIPCEIQVNTLKASVMADLDHDGIYKDIVSTTDTEKQTIRNLHNAAVASEIQEVQESIDIAK